MSSLKILGNKHTVQNKGKMYSGDIFDMVENIADLTVEHVKKHLSQR